MTGRTLNEIIGTLLAADGLSEKVGIVEENREALLTDEAEAALMEMAGRLPVSLNGPAVHRDLIRACRDHGVEDGGAGFADALVNLWLRENSLERKGALLKAWSDPLLSDEMLEGIKGLASAEPNPEAASMLRWHVQLLQRCRTRGVDLGVAAQQATGGGNPTRTGRPFDPQTLVAELNRLVAAGEPRTLPRQVEILETLLRPLSAGGAEEYALTRADLSTRLAVTLTRLVNSGLLSKEDAAAASRRADALNTEARTIRQRRSH